jgi:ferredoxin
MPKVKPHRLNVIGDFYVADDCCTACGVPETEAPGLFAYDKSGHCYVARQPAQPTELDQMLNAIRAQELGCVRYRGADKAVVRALAEARELAQWDGADAGAE